MKEPFEHQPLDNPSGGRSILSWNLHLWANGPDGKRPVRVDVSWPVRNPNPNGMPEDEEVEDLTTLQKNLVSLMKRRADAKYALGIVGDGVQSHVFYAPERVGFLRKKDLRDALGPALEDFGEDNGRELDVAFVEDAEWSRLLRIFASHDPLQWQADRALLLHMIKQRDAVGAKRPVAHRAHFDEREQCREFLQGARKLRFKSEGGPKQAKPGAPGAWTGVVVRKEQTLLTWHIHPVVLSIKDIVTRAGGVYDGWEAEIVSRKDPEPLAPPGGVKVG
jgi:hypothetical protein